MSYNPTDGYWYDISTESKLRKTQDILEQRFRETAVDLANRFEFCGGKDNEEKHKNICY